MTSPGCRSVPATSDTGTSRTSPPPRPSSTWARPRPASPSPRPRPRLITSTRPQISRLKRMLAPQRRCLKLTEAAQLHTHTRSVKTSKFLPNRMFTLLLQAFFASDGRSKKQQPQVEDTKPKYTCTECGKNYATSSNLSRHRQTHRTLDSTNAKKCPICNKVMRVKVIY